MAQGVNEKVQVYLIGTVFVGTNSTDLTTNWIRQMKALTGNMTARMKAIIVSAGTSN
jgi:hypothetical protein